MKRVVFTIVIMLLAAMVVGCANSDANLRRETARVIGNVAPGQVTVYDVDRGAMNVDWKASTPNGQYNCSSDDMMRRPFCVKAK
jgi:endonuclease V-like protein UPF0215 family